MADLARRATRWVGTFPYILTPIPNLYDHSFPRYGQITFLTFRRPTTLTFDLKFMKIFVSHGLPIRNMYAKFHNDRLRNGWDITHWNFAKTRTNKHTHKHTNKQTDRQTWALQYLALPLWGARLLSSYYSSHLIFKTTWKNYVWQNYELPKHKQYLIWTSIWV